MALPKAERGATVVVTGASSGIGVELARCLAERGHGLTLVARRRDRLDALAEELRAQHDVDVTVHPADLADREQRRALVAALDGVAVAGLCNNAGFGSSGAFASADQAREREEVELNVVALHELTGALLPRMLERGAGAILNVGSIAGHQPVVGMATYGATKAFVNSFTEALHAELQGSGVSVTLLAPGPVPTEFSQVARNQEAEKRLPGKVPPAEVARQAVEAMVKGRRAVSPGLMVKALTIGGRHAPRSVLLPFTRRFGGQL